MTSYVFTSFGFVNKNWPKFKMFIYSCKLGNLGMNAKFYWVQTSWETRLKDIDILVLSKLKKKKSWIRFYFGAFPAFPTLKMETRREFIGRLSYTRIVA